MQHIKWNRALGTAALGLILCAASPAHAADGGSPAFDYTAQSRSVSVDANAADLSGVADHHSDQQQAGGFDPFNGFVTTAAQVGAGSTAVSSQAIASQQSTLGNSAISVQGSVKGDSNFNAAGSGAGAANSLFAVDFSVSHPFDFLMTIDSNGIPDLTSPGNTSISIELKDSNGTAIAGPIADLNSTNVQKTGSLPAGKYSLSLIAQAASNDESFNFINYSVGFSATGGAVAPAPGQSGAASVPLPPALFSACGTLAVLGIIRLRQRGVL